MGHSLRPHNTAESFARRLSKQRRLVPFAPASSVSRLFSPIRVGNLSNSRRRCRLTAPFLQTTAPPRFTCRLLETVCARGNVRSSTDAVNEIERQNIFGPSRLQKMVPRSAPVLQKVASLQLLESRSLLWSKIWRFSDPRCQLADSKRRWSPRRARLSCCLTDNKQELKHLPRRSLRRRCARVRAAKKKRGRFARFFHHADICSGPKRGPSCLSSTSHETFSSTLQTPTEMP